MIIKYEIDEDDYDSDCLTPCPNKQLNNGTSRHMMVGSIGCKECKHFVIEDDRFQLVECNYEVKP